MHSNHGPMITDRREGKGKEVKEDVSIGYLSKK
jgi:hypothetical protein